MSVSKSYVVSVKSMRQAGLAGQERINSDAYTLNQSYAGTDVNAIFENGTFKSTVVALGSNPAVGSKPPLVPPSITSGEINLDGLGNPYTVLNFSVSQQVVDGSSVVAFKVYRQEIPAENLAQVIEAFNAADFDKLAQGTTKSGKFSADNKSQHQINASLAPTIKQNANLFALQQTSNQQQFGATVADPSRTSLASYFNAVPQAVGKKLLATINYQAAEDAAKLKQVYVQTNNLVELSYTDHSVTFGTGYLYTMTCFCATSEESSESTGLSMVVLDLGGIGGPKTLTVKQVTELKATMAMTVNPKDMVKRAYVFRRSTNDLVFHPFAVLDNANNSMSMTDTQLLYLESYIYRVILENVFGVLSEPAEVTLVCSDERILPKGRSNNLALPILLASQDQNSDGIKLTIFPNDHRVLYYTLERRNLTAGETVFSTPSNKDRQLWPLNQFFVQPNQPDITGSVSQIQSGSLPSQANFITFAAPIEFVDKVVAPGNYYQYRTVGLDIFGNKSGYGFASLGAHGKNVLRAPVNFTAEVLRESPFRVKLTWQDDNQASIADQVNQAQQKYLDLVLQQAQISSDQRNFVETMVGTQDLSQIDVATLLAPYNIQQAQITAIQNELQALDSSRNTLQFQLQRRLNGDSSYQSFPYTENSFVVDEVATPDAIPFSTTLVTASYVAQTSSLIPMSGTLSRSFGLPPFLQPQQVYQFRVAARTLDGQVSDFCAPITVVASAQISMPNSFSASILNPSVKPIVVKLQWQLDPLKGKPDHWRIERKANSATEDFVVIGNAYLINEYFDRSVQIDNQYIYRIRSVSAVGDESDIQTTSIGT